MQNAETAGKQPCPKCGEMADPVHRVAGEPAPVLRGWFCPYCGHFERATGRERGLDVEVKK